MGLQNVSLALSTGGSYVRVASSRPGLALWLGGRTPSRVTPAFGTNSAADRATTGVRRSIVCLLWPAGQGSRDGPIKAGVLLPGEA